MAYSNFIAKDFWVFRSHIQVHIYKFHYRYTYIDFSCIAKGIISHTLSFSRSLMLIFLAFDVKTALSIVVDHKFIIIIIIIYIVIFIAFAIRFGKIVFLFDLFIFSP